MYIMLGSSQNLLRRSEFDRHFEQIDFITEQPRVQLESFNNAELSRNVKLLP
jgi:hypothetical protein